MAPEPTRYAPFGGEGSPELVCGTAGAKMLADFEPWVSPHFLSPFGDFVTQSGQWKGLEHGKCTGQLAGTDGLIACPDYLGVADGSRTKELRGGRRYSRWLVRSQAPVEWYLFVYSGYALHLKYWKAVKEYCAEVAKEGRGG